MNIYDKIIVVDVETSGIIVGKNGLLSIGAEKLTSREQFYIETHLNLEQEFTPSALEVNGFTPDGCFDQSKASQEAGVKEFYKWVETFRVDKEPMIFAGHNPGFDMGFLKYVKHSWPFQYRSLDLHSLAFLVFGESLCMGEICDKLKVQRESKIHNALEGATAEAACFRELFTNYGRTL
jgi:DNA polymerase III alpha subunit (gram-positive type)